MFLNSSFVKVTVGFFVSCVSILALFQDGEDDNKANKIQFADAPPAVRDALAKLQPNVKFDEVEIDQECGTILYVGVWQVDGAENEIAVDKAGTLYFNESIVEGSDVPAAVAAAGRKAFPEGDLVFEKKTVVMYEVEVVVDGREHEILLSPSGLKMEVEIEGAKEDDQGQVGDDDDDDDDEVEEEDDNDDDDDQDHDDDNQDDDDGA